MSSVHTCRTWWAAAVSDLDLTQKSAPEVHVILVKLTQMLNISHIKTVRSCHPSPSPNIAIYEVQHNFGKYFCDVNKLIIGRID